MKFNTKYIEISTKNIEFSTKNIEFSTKNIEFSTKNIENQYQLFLAIGRKPVDFFYESIIRVALKYVFLDRAVIVNLIHIKF